MSSKSGLAGESTHVNVDTEPDAEANLTSIDGAAGDGDDFTERAYEPWLFQTMLSEIGRAHV